MSGHSESDQNAARRASLDDKFALTMSGLRAFGDSLEHLVEQGIKLYERMSERPNRGALRIKLQSELGGLIGKRRGMAFELENLLVKMKIHGKTRLDKTFPLDARSSSY